MKRIISVLVLFCISLTNAQSSWNKLDSENLALRSEKSLRKSEPTKFSLYNLNLENFKNELTAQTKGKEKIISLPGYHGKLENYYIHEYNQFTEPLNTKYGFIKTYSIQSVKNETISGKISIGTDGVHMILNSPQNGSFYIEPYTKDKRTYIGFDRKSLNKIESNFECMVQSNIAPKVKLNARMRNPNDGNLRTYRFALACTGEYATYHINDQGLTSAPETERKAAVLSAMNTSLARINQVFEKELAVKLNMVISGGENPVLFLDATNDGYTNNDISLMIDENISICNTLIGANNYDLGHLFYQGQDSGLAYTPSVCSNLKAGGVTGRINPKGDPFDIDYACHEIGHQFGANHTQNNSCQRNTNTSVEPGSGSTIMSYAGICAPNVQSNADDYFHAISIDEMWLRIQSTCATISNTNNTVPTANAGPDYSVPKNTPLKLIGSGTDSDGINSLTYNWEQLDNEVATMPPLVTNTVGPMFRSVPPNSEVTRYLPELSTVISGSTFSQWEVLPNVTRVMDFAFSVRDNQPGGGSSARDDMKITVTDATPFRVTSQNTSTTWDVESTATITWDKSTTDQAPINCQNVRIKLSTDGGLTFPIILAESTPNDGTHDIVVPNNLTNSARIMIEAVDNIFYNVNTTNFSVISTAPTFLLTNTSSKQFVCNSGGNSVEYDLTVEYVNGFNETISFSATDAPAGANISFAPTSISANGTVKMTITNLDGVTGNDYNITVNATSNSESKSVQAELGVLDGSFSSFNLTSPDNSSSNVSIVPTLTWESITEATGYDIQISTNNTFTNVILNTTSNTNSYEVSPPLSGSSIYFWRVRPKNDCATGNYTSAFFFRTENPSYCSSTFTDDAGGADHITNVTFNTINNTSGNDTVDGYIDYTANSTDINAGDSYQISVSFDPDGFRDHCYVFIDWNQDFNFDVTTERYDLGSISGTPGTRTANITVPNNAINGNTRMRVIIQYFDNNNFVLTDGACDSDHASEWGETEDYTVNVINATASIDDFDFTNFKVYPNPSNGNFNVTFEVVNTEKVNIKLFDIQGRLVEERDYKNIPTVFSEELNLNSVNAGLYLLQVQNGDKRTTRKLVIK
ncbi:hypothetical protein BTO06_13975 [Tenacibaculum sp. SZ-18]|uniref:reprolysin-like metallopeptidase n=1 Tax=Tenacibaculum sp. SZ-18 TaxID=754423 RepID=UPI000C2D0731|nr:zinc-dependent metalloprotease family protein [Tenacibaculum sp. SZ-18]AUC16201.1 hypothetical protein BTO06_13975 [Tenacibaculum sp. SZ-18]